MGANPEVEMQENGEGRRVLGEVDQNCQISQQTGLDGSNKIGSWKRKERAKGKEARIDKGEGKENMELGISHIGKKVFV